MRERAAQTAPMSGHIEQCDERLSKIAHFRLSMDFVPDASFTDSTRNYR
jgi:hypothetical protein